jgi:RHS repeat-associated protein
VLTRSIADGRTITFHYDANGNLTSLIPPGKTAHTFAYNTVNFPSTYTPPQVTGTGATSYTFDKDRNLNTITRPDAKKITFNYDTAGRLSQIVAPTETVNYAYNATTGNVASASIPSGESIAYGYNGLLLTSSIWTGTVAGSVSRTFNNNFWVTSLRLNGGKTINFTYDNDGLVTKAGAMTITHDPNDGLITGTALGGVADTRTYNSFGELTGYTAKYNTTTLYSVTYTRDADGRIASKTETINGKTTTYAYTYDKAGRLSGVKQNGATTSTYTYDTNSNRLTATKSAGTVSGTYDGQDRLLTYGTSSFAYTADGELGSQKSGTQTTTYQYDALGNLTSVTLPNATKLTYLIDPENHRVAKQVNGTQQTGYLYDGDQIVAQLNSSNQIVNQFVYATGVTSPDYIVNGSATYRIISDQLGSPRLLVSTATGAVAEQMNYDEFGNVLLDSDASFQPFGFAGGLKDPDTGLVRFGARDYNPATGRWTAKDPIGFSGGDSNLYGYVLNDPVNLIDFAGMYATVCRVGNTVMINIPITFKGPGATPELISRWNRAIEQAWSGDIGGYNVQTSVTTGPQNQVTVPVGNSRAEVTGSNTGTWPSGRPGETAAHEAGHLMGLTDMYTDALGSFPGWEKNIMGNKYGKPSGLDILLILLGNKNNCPCGK